MKIVGFKLSNTDTANNKNQISGNKSEAPSVTPNEKKKTGDDIYSYFGFKCILSGGTKLPLCVIC